MCISWSHDKGLKMPWSPEPELLTPASGVQTLYALDMFGASQRVATCFMDRGFPAKALDFLLSPEQDILSRRGWYLYLDHLLMMTFGQLSLFFVDMYMYASCLAKIIGCEPG